MAQRQAAGNSAGVISSRAPALQGAGYTLIELAAVLLIAGILLVMAIPSVGTLVRRQQMTATVADFFAALQLARSEAIRRGMTVTVVPAGETNAWTSGWLVLVDRNGNHRADPDEEIIFSRGPVPGAMSITDTFPTTGRVYLAYSASGYSRSTSNAPRAGSWTFSLDQEVRRIIINFNGRPRLCNPKPDPTGC